MSISTVEIPPPSAALPYSIHPTWIALDHYRIGPEDAAFTFAQRRYNGTPATAHAAGATVVLGGNNLTVGGSDTIYRDFEVLNSDPVRQQTRRNSQNAPRLRGVR